MSVDRCGKCGEKVLRAWNPRTKKTVALDLAGGVYRVVVTQGMTQATPISMAGRDGVASGDNGAVTALVGHFMTCRKYDSRGAKR